MPRTPLLREIAKSFAEFRRRQGTANASTNAASGGDGQRIDRRQFLAASGAVVGSAALSRGAKSFGRSRGHVGPPPARKPRIAIIGGGIAGVTAALELADYGFPATIYEASNRIGGRMHSDTTSWANNQVTEHCGELIDTAHIAILGLAERFNISYVDLLAAEPANSSDTFYFSHSYYPDPQLESDYAVVGAAAVNDANNAGFPTLYNSFNGAGFALDHMSIYDWIESRVPGGHRSRLGNVLDVAYNTEYGAPTTVQSALNIVYLLGFPPDTVDPQSFAIFGTSDERFHLVGGNEQLPQAIASSLPGPVELNTALTGIAHNGDGTFTLALSNGRSSTQTIADQVIMAIPFSVLRTLDIDRAGFSSRKLRAINTVGYGENGKLQLQFNSRYWNNHGPWGVGTGTSFADTGYQSTWEATRAQPGHTGIMVDYTGVTSDNNAGESSANSAAAVQALARRFLSQIEPVFPGISAQWNGRATLDYPANNPLLLGSYSYWKIGQYTGFSGVEREPSGNCHFAGEHTSILFQGFMEGGAEEGQRAADEILAGLGLPVTVAAAGESPDPGTLYNPNPPEP